MIPNNTRRGHSLTSLSGRRRCTNPTLRNVREGTHNHPSILQKLDLVLSISLPTQTSDEQKFGLPCAFADGWRTNELRPQVWHAADLATYIPPNSPTKLHSIIISRCFLTIRFFSGLILPSPQSLRRNILHFITRYKE